MNGPSKQDSRWRRRRQSLLRDGADLFLTVVPMLGLFLLFIGILLVSFPKGSGLSDLYGDLVDRDSSRSVLVLGGEIEGEAQVAVLSQASRTVKDRPAEAVAWKSAEVGMPIGDQHAIQTQARSSASIEFGTNNVLEMGENSLVIVKRATRRRRRTDASIVVLGGQIRGRVAARGAGGRGVQVLTSGAESTIRGTGDEPAEYAITVNEDNSATVSVFSGEAAVTSGGKTARIEPNQALTLVPDQPPGPVRPIPDAAALQAPDDGSQLTFGAVAPQVDFRWREASGADQYRLRIARDPAFADVVFETTVASTEMTFGNLREGSYYWRVDGVQGRVESPAGETRELRLVRDAAPPALAVVLPDEVIASDQLVVRGTTDPGAEVIVDNRPVAVAGDGTFEVMLKLRQGPNLVVVEAIDAAGNIAYHSQYINAKF